MRVRWRIYRTLKCVHFPWKVQVPIFSARVVMMSRLSNLSGLSTHEQVQFLQQHPALVRLCFMEYALNALMDWLPCEKELIFRTSASMSTYVSIAVAMCDVFRQDTIVTGGEDWARLNKVGDDWAAPSVTAREATTCIIMLPERGAFAMLRICGHAGCSPVLHACQHNTCS